MFNIKSISKYLALCLFVSSASAATEFLIKAHPYVGIDAEWRHMGYKKGDGDNLFRKNVPQGNIYAGLELNQYFRIEGGYEATPKVVKTATLVPGTPALGFVLLPGDLSEGTHFTTKLSGWYVNFIGVKSLTRDDTVRIFAGAGFSHKRLVLIQSPFLADGIPLDPELIEITRRTFTKRTSLLRLSAGIEKMLNDCWGVRAVTVWENTHKFSILKPKENPTGITRASAKNSITVGLGVFLKF